MTMDERLEKKDMRRLKIEWDKKSAVQSFRRVLIIINTCLEAVHSTWRRIGTKILCFAQKISVSDGSTGCDIVDDRIDGKNLHQPLKLFRK